MTALSCHACRAIADDSTRFRADRCLQLILGPWPDWCRLYWLRLQSQNCYWVRITRNLFSPTSFYIDFLSSSGTYFGCLILANRACFSSLQIPSAYITRGPCFASWLTRPFLPSGLARCWLQEYEAGGESKEICWCVCTAPGSSDSPWCSPSCRPMTLRV